MVDVYKRQESRVGERKMQVQSRLKTGRRDAVKNERILEKKKRTKSKELKLSCDP